MEIAELIPPVLGLASVLAYIGCAAWGIGDAQRRGHSGAFVLLFLLCGPLGAVVWFFVRPPLTLARRPVEDFTNADDALDAASRLDRLGDWDEAITVYESAAARWPEHDHYIKTCLDFIREKKAER